MLKELIEKIKSMEPDEDDIFYYGLGYAYQVLIKKIINLLESSNGDICSECNGTGYVKHECNPKHVKTLIPYGTNGLDEIIYLAKCSCGKYYWEHHVSDPGAGSSHDCIEIDDELASRYLENFISGYCEPERR